jgi:5-methylcytosine-specific restriction endonuclease McrA
MILGKSQKDAFVEMKDASRDHIVPFSEGGHNSPSNIRLAHKECNGLRGVRSVMELKRDGL